jgi:hypothetical protein
MSGYFVQTPNRMAMQLAQEALKVYERLDTRSEIEEVQAMVERLEMKLSADQGNG